MGWRKQIRNASFRKVPFHCKEAKGDLGRRVAVHEFPLRDDPYPEDLGRKSKTFTLEMIVSGPNYMQQRDLLAAAIDQPGAGELIHPWRGTLRVVVLEASLSESTRNGGQATFSVKCITAGKNIQPTASVDTPTQVKSKATAAIAAVESNFADSFSVDNLPEFVATDSLNLTQSALDLIGEATALIPGTDQAASGTLTANLSRVSTGLSGLLRKPGTLSTDMTGSITALAGLAQSPQDNLRGLRKLWSFGSDWLPLPETTITRRLQATNRQALTDLVIVTAVANSAALSADIQFASSQDAIASRDELLDQIETLAETANDDVYAALADLRAAIVQDTSARGGNLALLVTVTPAQTEPALVTAYRLYGDADRADDIVERNNIEHPGFVPGGEDLEVLSNV